MYNYISNPVTILPGKKSESEMAASLLFQTLKDHKHMEPIRLLVNNKKKVVQKVAAERGFEIQEVELLEDCKSVNVVFTERLDKDVRETLKENLQKIRFTGIDYKLEDLQGPGILHKFIIKFNKN